MNYSEATDYLERHTNLGVKPGLERIQWLVESMGRPDRCAPAIHITGTNGKTTVARIVAQILQVCGMRTGTYTSPHLERINERIAIDCMAISDATFAQAVGDVAPFVELMGERLGDSATYFEIVTAAAFAAFAETPVSIQVLEVGMGGAWDATNVAHAHVAAFTSIGLDHTDYLGETIEEIAREKAGIVKPESSVVLGYMAESAKKQVEAVARGLGAKSLICAGDDFELTDRVVAHGGQVFSMSTPLTRFSDLYLPLHGEHQALNATTAVVAAEVAIGVPIEEDVLRGALERVTSPGRIEVVGRSPLVVLDGAHNPAGARALMEAVAESFLFERLILVVGVLQGKDLSGIISTLGRDAALVIATQAADGPALRANEVGAGAKNSGCEVVEVISSLPEALDRALGAANSDDLVLVAGSLYLVGEARSLLVNG